MGNTIADLKKEIQHYETLLKAPGKIQEQTWIELQLIELKKQLKSAKKKP